MSDWRKATRLDRLNYGWRWWLGLTRERGIRFAVAWVWWCWRSPSARLINPRPLDAALVAGLMTKEPV